MRRCRRSLRRRDLLMRYDPATAGLVVIDLLARADSLAATAVAAIRAGDDATLAAAVEERGEIIAAALTTWQDATDSGHRESPSTLSQVRQSAQVTIATGRQAAVTATIERDKLGSALSALDARQQASQEYQPDAARNSIDVVL